MSEPLQQKLEQVSNSPGVYLMKDAGGNILYVGKALSLKKRLASYFLRSGHPDRKTERLIRKIADFTTIVTNTEQEALILESSLIKRHKPRYNVILKDDKRYPVLCLTVQGEFPYLCVVRKMKQDGNLYFGPYTSSGAVSQTLKTIQKTFKIRKCKDTAFRKRSRPCLNYQIGACLAPCCLPVDRKQYKEMVDQVILFLSGRTRDLIRRLKSEMEAAAAKQEFEQAATLRDRMFSLQKIAEKQVAVSSDLKDRDVVAIAERDECQLITLMAVRGGFLQGIRHYELPETLSRDNEILSSFIRQYYARQHLVPREILLSLLPEDKPALEEWILATRGKKTFIHQPQRGPKRTLIDLAVKNAREELALRVDRSKEMQRLLQRLQKKLGMSRPPARIECIDNSNFAGQSAVAGIVVYQDGRPCKAEYRKFSIKTISHPDDYASMREILGRRFDPKRNRRPDPDLLVVDGGKGQLNVAISVLREMKRNQAVTAIGIAKKEAQKGEVHDKIFLPGRMNPVSFGKEEDLRLFIQSIRDEAHRFAVSFHRGKRGRKSMKSALDDIPGIGPGRKKTLLSHFGSLEKIQAASENELRRLPGMNAAVAAALKKGLVRNRSS